jgi:hypothetical protein
MSNKIKVTVDQLGNPKIEAEGFVGSSCEAATAPIEAALAGKGGITRDLKHEYYEAATEQQEQQTW